jgi:hypothetical protein
MSLTWNGPRPVAATPTGNAHEQHGRHHIERPDAVPVHAFVPVRPDLPSGRRRAPLVTQVMRTLRGER